MMQHMTYKLGGQTVDRRLAPITDNGLIKWSNCNRYRTSYNDMKYKYAPINKTGVIPGYGGYVPQIGANGLLGRNLTELSKNVFKHDQFEDKKPMFASTGFNALKIGKQDHTMQAINHKYGSCTIPTTHPHIRSESWSTNIRDTYYHPSNLPRPNIRANSPPKKEMVDFKLGVYSRPYTQARSGFVQARQLFDGTGWVPDKTLHSDMFRTEYRGRFNPDKPFHNVKALPCEMKMKKKYKVYDPLDA